MNDDQAKQPSVHHGLALDAKKARFILRISIGRKNPKVVAKRLRINLYTDHAPTAVFARNAVLDFAGKLGLRVIFRPQRRRFTEGGQDA